MKHMDDRLGMSKYPQDRHELLYFWAIGDFPEGRGRLGRVDLYGRPLFPPMG